MYEHLLPHHAGAVRRNLFCKWRRRRAGVGQVLIAVPGASDASVNDLSFAERPVLVLAHIRHRRDISVVLEPGDPLASARHNAGALLRNLLDATNGDVSVRFRSARRVLPSLHDRTHTCSAATTVSPT